MTDARDLSPKQIATLRRNLNAFREVYVGYLNATVVRGRHPATAPALRREVSEAMLGAQRAMEAADANPAWDTRHAGGPLFVQLPNLVFLHETAWGANVSIVTPGITPYQGLLDALDLARARLCEMEEQSRRRRRNPLYWGDRLLRVLLGIPAYLVSLVFHVPIDQIENSAAGRPLRIAAFVVSTSSVVIGLHQWTGWF